MNKTTLKGSLPGILLGSSADFADILCYAAGTALIYAAERCFGKIRPVKKQAIRL